MTDRELIEAAAAVAGYKHNGWHYADGSLALDGFNERRWNPLTDDGDAFRLLVKLNLYRSIVDAQRSVDYKDDQFSATRRAIVCAAAARADVAAVGDA